MREGRCKMLFGEVGKRSGFWSGGLACAVLALAAALMIALAVQVPCAFAAGGDGSGGGGGGGKDEPLVVAESFPENGASGVSLEPGDMWLRFSKNVADPSISGANAALVSLVAPDGSAVDAKVWCKDAQIEPDFRQYIYITPNAPLEPNTTYSIVAKAGIAAKNGINVTEVDEAIAFTTAAAGDAATSASASSAASSASSSSASSEATGGEVAAADAEKMPADLTVAIVGGVVVVVLAVALVAKAVSSRKKVK